MEGELFRYLFSSAGDRLQGLPPTWDKAISLLVKINGKPDLALGDEGRRIEGSILSSSRPCENLCTRKP